MCCEHVLGTPIRLLTHSCCRMLYVVWCCYGLSQFPSHSPITASVLPAAAGLRGHGISRGGSTDDDPFNLILPALQTSNADQSQRGSSNANPTLGSAAPANEVVLDMATYQQLLRDPNALAQAQLRVWQVRSYHLVRTWPLRVSAVMTGCMCLYSG